MFCPNCGHECAAQDRFCSNCGAPLSAPVRPKMGRHWVPILIMTLIFAIGTGLFFAFPVNRQEKPPVIESQETPWFYADNGIVYFDAKKYTGGSELTVPAELNGQRIIALGEGCFKNCDQLTSVILPDTLQAIGEDAFSGCTALRGIEIPESVMLIGEGAFSGCAALEAICVYEGVRSIGEGAFSGCSKLFYIYFSGDFQEWNELYAEFINPYTTVFAEDGTFYQGETPAE